LKKPEKQYVDKRLVASSFEASAATYEANAIVQREISGQLISLLRRHNLKDYSRVFEIGCCTGVLTELISCEGTIDYMYVNDIVPGFCELTRERIRDRVSSVEIIPGDVEGIVFPDKLGLVISSSTFQWMTDLPALFKKAHSALKPGSYLAFTIFGPGTMAEISEITGRSLNYHSSDTLAGMLKSGFRTISIHTEKRCLYFPTVRAILRHIQQTGVGGLGRTKWTREKLKAFEQQYISKFSSDFGVPVSYVSTFVLVEKI